MKNIVLHSSILLAGGTALAHDGHVLGGSHWHTGGGWAWIATAVAGAALLIWHRRRGR